MRNITEVVMHLLFVLVFLGNQQQSAVTFASDSGGWKEREREGVKRERK